MPCFGPLVGYHGKKVSEGTGKRPIVFDLRKSFDGRRLIIPCGECVGCRLIERKQWAVRCIHEKRMFRQSAFVTLTYDPAHVPAGGSLRLRDLQLFLKRLRIVRPAGLRFFACGEYGDTLQRPHYHLLLLNTDFPDRRRLKETDRGDVLYRSAELAKLWTFGNSDIGDVSDRSCAYVCGYVLKKVGKVIDYGVREPEFRTMSLRPGLGKTWFDKFWPEVYAHDSVIVKGRESSVPKYYDNLYKKLDESELEYLKLARAEFAFEHPEDSTRERLRVREKFEQLKAARFAREV